MITRLLTNHTHYNSPYETCSDCGNCGGSEVECDACRVVYQVNNKEFYNLEEARNYDEQLKLEEKGNNSLTHREIIETIIKSLGFSCSFKNEEITFREFINQDGDAVTVYSRKNKYDVETENQIFSSFYSTIYGHDNQRSQKINKRLKEMQLNDYMDIDIITVLSVLMCVMPILKKELNILNLMSILTYWIDSVE